MTLISSILSLEWELAFKSLTKTLKFSGVTAVESLMVLPLAKATSHNNLGSDIEGITVDKDALLACSEISIKENDFALRRGWWKGLVHKNSCVIRPQELWYMKDGSLLSRQISDAYNI